MNKRKGILDTVDKTSKQLTILLEVMYRYYKIYDLDFGAVYSEVFYELYIAEEKLTFESICQSVGIGMTTLKAYRKRFDNLATRLLEKGIIK